MPAPLGRIGPDLAAWAGHTVTPRADAATACDHHRRRYQASGHVAGLDCMLSAIWAWLVDAAIGAYGIADRIFP
jgi:hypothetical protein